MRQLKITGGCFQHCLYSNNPLPPTSFFPDIQWVWDAPTDPDDVYFYTHNAISRGITDNAGQKICWMIEPLELIGGKYAQIESSNNEFDYVFTHEKTLLDREENYKFIPFGGCWIPEDERIMPEYKDKMVSIISSQKNSLRGHNMRHETIRRFGSALNVYGRGYSPVDSKLTVHKDYFFSVVIENCKRDYWFTEKLIDSLILGCMPIYWGCPSIGDFFDIDGIIVVDTIEDIERELNNLSTDYYMDRFEHIHKNQELAKQYVLSEKFIYEDFIIEGLI